jgi:hypothetical protein
MKSFIFTLLLLSTLFVSLTNSTKSKTIDNAEEPREDYGCLHEDHSQYEDGDSLNLEMVNYNNNH